MQNYELIKDKKTDEEIKYMKQFKMPRIKVNSFDEIGNEVIISAQNLETNKIVEFRGKYLFLGSGAISSTKILMNTLKIKSDISLSCKDQYVVPIYLKFNSKFPIQYSEICIL